MRENKIRTLWKAGGFALSGWLNIPDTFAAEVMAHAGWDVLTIDMQHGLTTFDTAVPMLQTISTTETVPFARVPWNEPGIIGRMLDAGCYGIICPMINTRAQAEAFVGACRYPPLGYRSLGPTRVSYYAGADYVEHANDTIITMAMIETAEALRNVDEICRTPGLDAVYVGPSDLSHSMGLSDRANYKNPDLLAAIDSILAAAKAAGIVAGAHTATVEDGQLVRSKGFQFATVSSDTRLLALGANTIVKAMKSAVGAH